MDPEPSPSRLIRERDAARLLDCPGWVIRRLADDGLIRLYNLPGAPGYPIEDVQAVSAQMVRDIADEKSKQLTAELSAARDRIRQLEGMLGAQVAPFVSEAPEHRQKVRGWYVYLLRDEAGEIVYIGQSRNVFARVGNHLTTSKAPDLDTVQIVECADEASMHATEAALIRHHRPKHNVSLNPDVRADDAAWANELARRSQRVDAAYAEIFGA